MNMRLGVAAGLMLAAASGACTHEVEMSIRNPISARAIDQNKIVKADDDSSDRNGLRPGTIRNEAVLTVANAKRVCFNVLMRSLSPLNLSRVEAKLVVPKQPSVETPQISNEEATSEDLPGKIPETRESGSETYCAYRDSNNNCTSWRTRPTYVTVWVPGTITVHQHRGSVCFPNKGILTSATPQISLELSVPVQGRTGMFGTTESKEEDFTWGFGSGGGGRGGAAAASTEGDEEEAAPAPARAKAAPAPVAEDPADEAPAPPPPPQAKGGKKKRPPAPTAQDD